MSGQTFNSEFGYSIVLPDNWSEYELEDEKNTNGFFDTSGWTGNLRVTPLNIKIDSPKDFIESELTDTNITELNWDNIKAFSYSEASDDLWIYYWYLIENSKIYICSFTIDIENKENEKNRKELIKVEDILKTLKTK
ncbi:MAG: DUF3805 domain-containing protein [Bacteroidia bacterium]|nr:DUF3805 domain-containing protein [Bacteroidia bacterium]